MSSTQDARWSCREAIGPQRSTQESQGEHGLALRTGHAILKVPSEKAGMAKLADAADLKSADPKGLWGFKSPSRHQQCPYFHTVCCAQSSWRTLADLSGGTSGGSWCGGILSRR